MDTWFPVYRVRHPDVDRAEIVAHLASLVDERRRRGFPDDERPAPPAIPDTAVLFESPLARRGIRGIVDTPFATTSGVAKASAFKLIDLDWTGCWVLAFPRGATCMARKPARSIDRATKPELLASSMNSLRAVSRPA